MTVDLESAVRADLEAWGLLDTSLAAAALDVVERLGADDLRPAAAAMLHQRLDGYLVQLRAMAPAEVSQDGVDDLAAGRAARKLAVGEE